MLENKPKKIVVANYMACRTCRGSNHLLNDYRKELNIEQESWSSKYLGDQRCINPSFRYSDANGSTTPSYLLNLLFET